MSSCICQKCFGSFDLSLPQSVNVGTSPELKEKVLSGELFLHECPHCGEMNLVRSNMLYVDPLQKYLLCLSDSNISSVGEIPGYTCRLVSSVGELIEKIKIFDAGLDDVVVEMCKFVTAGEIGTDEDFRFYRMDGADNEMILTYPKSGRMEMIAIGFNVYEDCRGIVLRNPSLSSSALGLVRIDKDWLRRFVG